MTERAKDHVRIANTAAGGHALICTHCGTVYVPALPISVDGMLALMKSFGKEHGGCRPANAGAFPVDLLLEKANIGSMAQWERDHDR